MTTFVGPFHHRDINENKKEWFRIPEREGVKTKVDKKLASTFWWVDKFIARAGYFYEPMDFDPQVVEEKAREMVRAEIRMTFGIVPEAEQIAVRKKAANIEERLFQKYGVSQVYYKARGQLVHEMMQGQKKERTLWYANALHGSKPGNYCMLTGTKHVVTGEYYEASGGTYWGYEGQESDYEGPGLSDMTHIMLYQARLFVSWGYPTRYDEEHFLMYGDAVLIHPLDLMRPAKLTDINQKNPF